MIKNKNSLASTLATILVLVVGVLVLGLVVWLIFGG
jgi:hypothetical protein